MQYEKNAPRRVFATARTEEDAARLERAEGLEALYLDLSSEASIAACADTVLARTGSKLTALFNNGAYGQLGAVEDLTPQVLRTQLEVNLIGTHDLTRRVIPAMRKAGEGRIVQCSSVLGFVVAPYRGAYCASKFALEALSDTLRLELQGSGVFVSIIEPGPIRSRFVETALANFKRTIPIETSPHRERYLARIAALEAGGASTFKLEPEAVAEKLIHAVESARPRIRYRVTTPTHIAHWAKRLLPANLLDWLSARN